MRALHGRKQNMLPVQPMAGSLRFLPNNRAILRARIAKSAARRTAGGSIDDKDFTMASTPIAIEQTRSDDIPEERLKLMFACAHPAIDGSVHTPLMLQTVLGFEANDIASAYLMPGATLAQRLVRAKR